MSRPRRTATQSSVLSPQHFVAAAAATVAALIPSIASAQALPEPQRYEVMIWTATIAVLALSACAVGFAYRRMRGMDHPTPDEIELMGGHGHSDDHGEGDGEAPSHAEVEHAPTAAHH
jgi:hypothetical protein